MTQNYISNLKNLKTNFDNNSVAFALITYFPKWYRGKLRSIKHTDKVRGDLALEFINKASENGYQVIVVDGKSSKTFQRKLRSIQFIHFARKLTSKRSPKRRMALHIASGFKDCKVIVVTEAEKVSLLTDCIAQIVTPILENKADIVIPKRDEKLFKFTYPDYMYESEKEGNMLYNENLRLHGLLQASEDLDMFFGPRVIRNEAKILKLFMKKYRLPIKKIKLPHDFFDTEEYSNSIYFPIIEALKRNVRVVSVTVPFSYPLLQKQNEEKGEPDFFVQKRRVQKLSLLLELMYFLYFFSN